MNNGTSLSSSDYEMASKVKKNRCATFEIKMNMRCYYLKVDDDAVFKNRSKRPTFLLRPLNSMHNTEVKRLSLQKLEHKNGLH